MSTIDYTSFEEARPYISQECRRQFTTNPTGFPDFATTWFYLL
ncbi:MAG: hypothetical protein RL235_485 [Chlamydiota bacterium]|jgi:hypothetical protein